MRQTSGQQHATATPEQREVRLARMRQTSRQQHATATPEQTERSDSLR